MTREAKIGMLTGLGVIVLIGVLLSEYLGDPKGLLAGASGTGSGKTAVDAAGTATGRMAELPIGAAYRQQVLEPIGIPGMQMSSPVASANGTNGPFVSSNVVIPPAYATEPVAEPAYAGPTIGAPVTAVAAGPAPRERQIAGGPATFTVAEPRRELPANAQPINTAVPNDRTVTVTSTPAGTPYVIAPGDNLAKISRKFYNSNKLADVQRIVAANPAVLKDANTILVAGRKLTIPMPLATEAKTPQTLIKATAQAAPTPPAALRKTESVMIFLPGPLETESKLTARSEVKSEASVKSTPAVAVKKEVATPAASATKVYVVQSGDTLEKIAKKLAPAGPTAMIEKLKAGNGIKDVHALQVGQKIKLPG